MEVGQAVLALDFIDSELNFAECMVFVVLEVGERDFEDSTFEGIVGVLETGCSVYQGFANTTAFVNIYTFLLRLDYRILSNIECRRCLEVVPIFPGEGILGSLLEAFLAL